MKIWILNRVIPDKYGRLHKQFFTAFKTLEGAKEYVTAMGKESMEGWKNVGGEWIKKCRIVSGYWDISSSNLHD